MAKIVLEFRLDLLDQSALSQLTDVPRDPQLRILFGSPFGARAASGGLINFERVRHFCDCLSVFEPTLKANPHNLCAHCPDVGRAVERIRCSMRRHKQTYRARCDPGLVVSLNGLDPTLGSGLAGWRRVRHCSRLFLLIPKNGARELPPSQLRRRRPAVECKVARGVSEGVLFPFRSHATPSLMLRLLSRSDGPFIHRAYSS